MSRGDYDDRDDDRDDRRRGGGPAAAAAKTKTPGTFLQIVGVLSIVGWLAYMAFAVFAPEALIDWAQKMQAQAPAGAQKEQQQQKLEEAKKRLEESRGAGLIQNAGLTVLGVVLGVLMLVGGGKMKRLNGYGLAVTGSVAALVPCSSLCCIGALPFGIWALVVLMNADVKRAFGKGAPERRRDDFDDRDDDRPRRRDADDDRGR